MTVDKNMEQTKPNIKVHKGSFKFGTVLGEGSYATVQHAVLIDAEEEEFAIKIMDKRFIKKMRKVPFVMMEKSILSRIKHRNIVKLYYSFQDERSLYMVMELVKGGELLRTIKHYSSMRSEPGKLRAFTLNEAQYYTAVLVDTLEYLHTNQRIIHRDLKPENILLTESGNLKLIDFGTALDENDSNKNHTAFVGTAEYVSPEVLTDEKASHAVDLWALGCIIYQMITGVVPFKAESEFLMFNKILEYPSNNAIEFPDYFPQVAKELILNLLVQDTSQRLGAGSKEDGKCYMALKSHPFFDGIDWSCLHSMEPPLKPPTRTLPSPYDVNDDFDDLCSELAEEIHIEVISSSSSSNYPILPSNGIWNISSSDINSNDSGSEVYKSKDAADITSPPTSSKDNNVAHLLNDNETVCYSSTVWKKPGVGLFSKKRELILTSASRLLYVNPETMELRGEIELNSDVQVYVRAEKLFDIMTDTRTYHITEIFGKASNWKEAIDKKKNIPKASS